MTQDVTASLGVSVYVSDSRASVSYELAKMSQQTTAFTKHFGTSFRDVSSVLRRAVSEVRFFGAAIAGAFGVSLSSVAIGGAIADAVRDWQAGVEALKQLSAQERIAGQASADFDARVKQIVESGKKWFGATVEQTTGLISQARALGLNAEQTQLAVEAAQALNKAAGADLGSTLDSVGRGLLGNVDSMKKFGNELRLRVENADDFAKALQRVRAEVLEAEAAALSEQKNRNLGSLTFGTGADYEAAVRRIRELSAEAARIRASAALPDQGKETAAKAERIKQASRTAVDLADSFRKIANAPTELESVPGRIQAINSKLDSELIELTKRYREGFKKLKEAGLDSNSPELLAAEQAYYDAIDQMNQKSATERITIERQVAAESIALNEESAIRMAQGRERERLEIEAGYDQELRALEDKHRKGLVSEEAYLNARLALQLDFERKQRQQQGGFGAGAVDRMREIGEQLNDTYSKGREVVDQLAGSIENNLGDALYGFASQTMNAKDAWKSFVSGLGDDMLRAASQNISKLATQAIFGLLGSAFGATGGPSSPGQLYAGGGLFLADGGVVGGSGAFGGSRRSAAEFARAAHGARFRAFDQGGVAHSPTLGLFGERGSEAFIPLKHGTIPVSLRGGGGGMQVLNLYLSAIDTQSGIGFLHQHREELWQLHRDGFDRRSEFRGMARRS